MDRYDYDNVKSIADHFENFKDFLIDAQEEFVKPEGDSAPADALLTNNVVGREDYPLERKVCCKVYPKAFHDAPLIRNFSPSNPYYCQNCKSKSRTSLTSLIPFGLKNVHVL